MILSEEQARTKWCPFARVAYAAGCEGAVAFNRASGPRLPEGACCIASGCMAWRPIEGVFRKSTSEQIFGVYSSTDPDIETRPTGSGFCGLAEREL